MSIERRTSRKTEYNRSYYFDGNTVRVEDPLQEEPQRRKKTSKRTRKNRAKATSMNREFVVFMAVISVMAMFMCVYYIQLKTEITRQTATIAARESTLTDLKADNDALENSVNTSVDLDEILRIATEKLGMHYPTEEQIQEYSTDGSGYVRQYADIPEE